MTPRHGSLLTFSTEVVLHRERLDGERTRGVLLSAGGLFSIKLRIRAVLGNLIQDFMWITHCNLLFKLQVSVQDHFVTSCQCKKKKRISLSPDDAEPFDGALCRLKGRILSLAVCGFFCFLVVVFFRHLAPPLLMDEHVSAPL